MTRLPLFVPVLLSCALRPVSAVPAGLDHDAVGRAAAGRVDGLVDRVAAVRQAEDIGVVPQAAVERVGARAADQHVVPAEPVQGVVAGQAQQQVVAGGAVQRVVAVRAGNDAEGGVGELQALDVAQRVGAFDRVDPDVGDREPAVGVGAERVVGQRAQVGDRVDVARASVSVLIVRTIASWPGLICPANMLLTSVFMLLCSAIGRAGVVGVVGGEDADLHVEPLVAVDDVVAAAAHDEVAAVAAEDDVAGRCSW